MPLLTILVSVLIVWQAFKIAAFHQRAQDRIRSELRRVNAANIEVRTDWLELVLERGSIAYDVTFTAMDGRRQVNTASVSRGEGDELPVTWERTLVPAA